MKLCAPIKWPSLEAIENANQFADLMEWRLDLFDDQDNLELLRRKVTIPLIITIKSQSQIPLIDHLKPDWVDLPHFFPRALLKELCAKYQVIVSYHQETENDCYRTIFHTLSSLGAKNVKIAIRPKTVIETVRFLKFVQQSGCIGVALGKKGEISRVLAPFFGSPWTYAPISKEQQTAEGQLSFDLYRSLFRVQEFSRFPMLFGLIGDPLDQSQGDRIHNFVYSMLEIPALYLKVSLEVEELEEFLSLAPTIGFKGLSVTMPLKMEAAKIIGSQCAVNSLLFKDGHWLGCNTDQMAAIELLKPFGDLKGKRICVIGAGATGESICKSLIAKNAEVFLYNRTKERAESVARSLPLSAFGLECLKSDFSHSFDGIINASASQDPISQEILAPHHFVMDIASRGRPSPLLKKAAGLGCRCISGDDFYFQQAKHQCAFWFVDE